MKAIYFVIIMIVMVTSQLSAQTWQWTKPEPNGNLGVNEEYDDAHDIETDASGNAYVLGDFLGSLFLDKALRATGNGSYLAKYDSTGALLWYKLIVPASSTGAIKATDLTITAQGIFITGKYSPSNIGISGYDCNGGGTGTINSYSIGNYTFNSGIYNEAGFFVTRLNSNGGVVWNQVVKGQVCFDNGYNSSMSEIAYNPLITSDKSNNIICEFMYPHQEAKRTALSMGAGVIPLPVPTPGNNNFTFIVFKMNNAGTLLWSNYAVDQQTNSVLNECNSLITDNNGNVFLYGTANDGCAFGANTYHTTEYLSSGNNSWSNFIAKISSAGVWQLSKELHNYNNAFLESGGGNPDKLAVDNSGNIYAAINLAGNYPRITGDTVAINKTNSYLVKLDNDVNLIWYKGFGSNETTPNSIHFANDALYISGSLKNYVYAGNLWYFSNLHVQPSSPNYGGAFEYFVSKANTNGDFQWVTSFSSPYNVMEGFAVKAFNEHVYTSGYYRGNITSLGNLNGNYSGNTSTDNIFFGKLKDQSIRVGAVSAKQVMPGCSITIPFTSSGLTFSATNKFIAELSDINWEFTNPTVIGTVKSTGSGSIKATIPASLPVGTSGYKIRIRSSDTLPTGLNYFAYADTGYTLSIACPGTASGLNSTGITGTTATINWTAVGCAAGYKVQYRIKGTTAWTTQTTNSVAISLALSGLTANTIYQWRIATKCNNNGVNSFSAYSALQQFKTAASFAANTVISEITATNNLQLQVQPNPAKSITVLVINGNVKNASVIITDFVGKIVWKKDGVNAGQFTLPVQNLADGIYLVKLVNGSETSMVKLVKE